MVIENPVRRVKFFSEKDRSRTRYLNQNEKERLLAVCPQYLRRIVLVALKTGMRQGEILNLKWSDIDSNSNRITLSKTKSGKIRHIPIHPDVLKAFRSLPKVNDYVFYNERRGTRYSKYGKLRFDFEDAVKEAGLRNFVFHDLRHCFASHAINLLPVENETRVAKAQVLKEVEGYYTSATLENSKVSGISRSAEKISKPPR